MISNRFPLYREVEQIRQIHRTAIATHDEVLDGWRSLKHRLPELVQLRIVGEDRNRQPMWMGTIATSPGNLALDSKVNGDVALNAIHGVEYIGAMADVEKAKIIARAIACGAGDKMPDAFSSIIAINQASLQRNTYIGQPLSVESVVFGRHRPIGLDDNAEFAIGTEVPAEFAFVEAEQLTKLIEHFNPDSTTSNHGATCEMADYAEVLPGYGNRGFCNSISAVLGPAALLQQFSPDLPGERPLAPGVFPAAGAIGPIAGRMEYTMANFLRKRARNSSTLRGNYLVNEVALLLAFPRTVISAFDPEVVVRRGTSRIKTLLEPFSTRIALLPYDPLDIADVAAHARFRSLLGEAPTWQQIIPVPSSGRPRDLQQEYFALDDRRYFKAIMALGDFASIASRYRHTTLCRDVVERVRRALSELQKTTVIAPRSIADATAKYVELGFLNMVNTLRTSPLDFGREIDQRFEALSALPEHTSEVLI